MHYIKSPHHIDINALHFIIHNLGPSRRWRKCEVDIDFFG